VQCGSKAHKIRQQVTMIVQPSVFTSLVDHLGYRVEGQSA